MLRPLDQITGEITAPPIAKRKKIECFFDCIPEDIIKQVLSTSLSKSPHKKKRNISKYKRGIQSYMAVSKVWQRLCNQICFQFINVNKISPIQIFLNDYQIINFLDQCGSSLRNLYLDDLVHVSYSPQRFALPLSRMLANPESHYVHSFWSTSNLIVNDFLQKTPSLQKLSLNKISKLNLNLNFTMSSLNDLSFYNLHFNDPGKGKYEFQGEILSKGEISLLGRCFPHIKKLSIGNPEMENGFLECVTKSFVDLTDLHLGRKGNVYKSSVDSIFISESIFVRYDKITSLSIYHTDITREGFQRISYCLPNLNSLTLWHANTDLNLDDLDVKISGFSRLENLEINDSHLIPNEMLVELSRAQPQLKSLKLHVTEEIIFLSVDYDWASILPVFTQLNTLSISGLNDLPCYLQTAHLPTLENLTFLDYNNFLTEGEFKNIMNINPQLRKLEVREG